MKAMVIEENIKEKRSRIVEPLLAFFLLISTIGIMSFALFRGYELYAFGASIGIAKT